MLWGTPRKPQYGIILGPWGMGNLPYPLLGSPSCQEASMAMSNRNIDKWLSVHPYGCRQGYIIIYHHYYTLTSYDIPTFVGEAPIEHPLLGGFPRCAVGWFASRRHCSADFLGWGSFASSVAGNGRRGVGIVRVCSMRSHQNHNAKVKY